MRNPSRRDLERNYQVAVILEPISAAAVELDPLFRSFGPLGKSTGPAQRVSNPALDKQWSRDYPIDVPATPTRPDHDAYIRYQEALD